MGFKAKQATWRVALGLAGLVALPLVTFPTGAKAGESDTHLNLSIFTPGTESSQAAAEITIIPENLVPTFASVTTPKISAVDLFSNQSVFSLTSTAYEENTPISSLRSNSDAQFWQFTTLGGTVTTGMPSQTEGMLTSQTNYASQNASWIGSNLDIPTATFSKSLEDNSASLGIPTLADGHANDAGNNSNPTTATSLSSAAKAATLVTLANPVVSPDVVRSAIPDIGSDSPVPEPASIAMLGLAAAGLLGRRRVTR